MSNLNLLESYVFVKESLIHGTGLFTSIDITAGTPVMLIRGDVISEEECIRREDEGNVYIFWNETNYIDTIDTDKIKFINHNCDYNCEVVDGNDEYLILTASRDISSGEELTIDYGYEEIYDYCKCNLCTTQVA